MNPDKLPVTVIGWPKTRDYMTSQPGYDAAKTARETYPGVCFVICDAECFAYCRVSDGWNKHAWAESRAPPKPAAPKQRPEDSPAGLILMIAILLVLLFRGLKR